MKINLENQQRIESALRAVNGRATSYTITTSWELQEVAARVESDLLDRGIQAKNLQGTYVEFTPEGPPKSYGYSPKTTKATITRGAKGWFLCGILTAKIHPGQKEVLRMDVTEAGKGAIVAKALEGIARIPSCVSGTNITITYIENNQSIEEINQ